MKDIAAPIDKICQICGKTSWSWTDFHGIATCQVCGQTSYLRKDALPEERKNADLPASTLKPEFFIVYKTWWSQTEGRCRFDEWQDMGFRPVTDDEIKAFRAEVERNRVEEVLSRPIIHVKPWSGFSSCWHVGIYGPGIEKYVGAADTEEEAMKLGHAGANALEAVLKKPFSVVRERNQGLCAWLKNEKNFCACHPTLEVGIAQDGSIKAYLKNPHGHSMWLSGIGKAPQAEGQTPEDAVKNLLDLIRGRDISFSGYNNGMFHVPSDLVMDWKMKEKA